MLLGSLDRSRDNNFNLIRLLAALLVLVSHSYVLAPGRDGSEPWHTLGITPAPSRWTCSSSAAACW